MSPLAQFHEWPGYIQACAGVIAGAISLCLAAALSPGDPKPVPRSRRPLWPSPHERR